MHTVKSDLPNPELFRQNGSENLPNKLDFFEKCQKVLWFFLQQPGFKVIHHEPGSHVRQILDFEVEEWQKIGRELFIDKKILEISKSSEELPRSDTIQLSLDNLEIEREEHYVTPDMIEHAYDSSTD